MNMISFPQCSESVSICPRLEISHQVSHHLPSLSSPPHTHYMYIVCISVQLSDMEMTVLMNIHESGFALCSY